MLAARLERANLTVVQRDQAAPTDIVEDASTECLTKFEQSQTIPEVDCAAVAREFGLGGISVNAPDGRGPAWDEALSAETTGPAGRAVRPGGSRRSHRTPTSSR